jgi:primosomal protein N' (replication factor Y)
MHIIRVLLPHLQLPILDYLAPNDTFKAGDLVVVPFRSKEVMGIVVEVGITSEFKNLREIVAAAGVSISPKYLEFAFKTSKYYMAEMGSIAKLILPVEPPSSQASEAPHIDPDNFNDIALSPLSPSQSTALNQMQSYEGISVLQGVTGSGKTEVYFHLIADTLKQRKQALLMLPEIALSSQIIDRFTGRFGFKPDVWNSSITPAKKRKLLAKIISGESQIIIGTRSSLFLPYKDLALIIIDEEHDASYKQESGVLYNARDMAVLRSTIFGHPVVLGSATPSIETLHNANLGKYQLVHLTSRFGEASLPEVKIIDMRLQKMEKSTWLSRELKDAMASELGKGNQAMLFLNRRGYAPMMLCGSCGHRVTCKSCSSWMVLHKARKRLECHHCGDVSAIKNKCIECEVEDSYIACGPGVERIAEEAAHCFQNARIQLMTKEEMCSEAAIREILRKIKDQEVDILIGTQIITKGYHFPKLSLVGVIDADIGLGGGDLKGSERAFQLLHQVSGRAGREDTKGVVYLQTYDPEGRLIK